MKRWTKEEIEYLKKYAKKKTYKELAVDLHRTQSCVEVKMRKVNIKPKLMREILEWTKEEADYIKNNAKDKTCHEISNDLCRPYSSVSQKIHNLDITSKLLKKEWTKNEIDVAQSLASNDKTYQEIADELNRTKLSVERKLVRLCIKVRKQHHKEWPDDKVEYLKKYANKKTYYKLSTDQFLNKSI